MSAIYQCCYLYSAEHGTLFIFISDFDFVLLLLLLLLLLLCNMCRRTCD